MNDDEVALAAYDNGKMIPKEMALDLITSAIYNAVELLQGDDSIKVKIAIHMAALVAAGVKEKDVAHAMTRQRVRAEAWSN